MAEIWEVIEAFADGEPVDPGELKDALSAEAGREHLIELLALRGVMGSSGASRPVTLTTRRRPLASRLVQVTAAAALVVLSVAGGYLAGRRADTPAQPQPPPQAFTGGAVLDPSAPPAPTRVIRLEHGVDWDERKGGN